MEGDPLNEVLGEATVTIAPNYAITTNNKYPGKRVQQIFIITFYAYSPSTMCVLFYPKIQITRQTIYESISVY